MKLSKLFKNLPVIKITGDLEKSAIGICQDNRQFRSGNVFVAIRGTKYDGHLFVRQACENGASAVVVESEDTVPKNYPGVIAVVENSRQALDFLAASFYGFPSEKLFVAAVTGTNGKTTTTHMIEGIFANQKPTAVMGTIDYHFGNKSIPSTHTTPDPLATQKLFHDWIQDGAQAVSMEVSSHALEQSRVNSVEFDVAVFTNLTRDHLDFHQTMEEYAKAKAKLFFELMSKSSKKNKRLILNADDPYSKVMHNKEIPTWFYGKDGDLKIQEVKLSMDNCQFILNTPAGKQKFKLPMIGLHNVYNAAGAIGVGFHAGMDLPSIAANLEKLPPVKGRLQRVIVPEAPSTTPKRVFIDYAHTDDALYNVLKFLKALKDETSPKNKIITVFGCGGDRDKGKRPLMLQAATRFSDQVIVTSDNPRTEDPHTIIKDILGKEASDCTKTKVANSEVIVEVDRKTAIELAIKKADPGDVVLIAGKGHEDYQIIGTQKISFDDYKIAETALLEMMK